MSTRQQYVVPVEMRTWDVPAAGAARFSWEYDDGRDRLLALYQKGKDKQWDAIHRIDWDLELARRAHEVDEVVALGADGVTERQQSLPTP